MNFAITVQGLLLSDVAAFASGALVAVVLGACSRRPRAGSQTAAPPRWDPPTAFVEQNPDAIVALDAALTCTFASAAVVRILGQAPTDLLGRQLHDLTNEDPSSLTAAVSRARAGQVGAEAVFRAARPTGEHLWIEARFGAANPEGAIVLALRDVSTRKTAELALRVANLELNKLAGSDGLTGLANRRRFDQTLETECRRASRSMKPVSLLLLDVDRFEAFNDRYGHQAGDGCLKEIGAVLQGAAMRTSDMAARFGGEEFVLMLPGTDEGTAAAVAERVRDGVAALTLPHEGNAEAGGIVTVSIGCATVHPTPDTLHVDGTTLIAGADRALYDAKRLGRNRVEAPVRGPDAGIAAGRLIADPTRLARIESFRTAGGFAPSPSLHRLARMAAVLLGMPVAFVALLDRDETIVLGHHGMGAAPLPIPHGVGAELLGARGVVVVPTVAADARFRAFGAAHGLAFLAAAPLLSGDDLQHVGALWVFDRQARGPLTESKRLLLSRLAALAMEDLEARQGPPSSLKAVA